MEDSLVKEILEKIRNEQTKMFYPEGDLQHLGGSILSSVGDWCTFYPMLWEELVKMGCDSVLDVGCGGGYSTRYFKDLGCDVLGIERLQEAIDSAGNSELIMKHDYTSGKLNLGARRFKLCWCCEFVEHVEDRFKDNFFDSFKRCDLVVCTAARPGQSGHHHVNLRPVSDWIADFETHGFKYCTDLTDELKRFAKIDVNRFGMLYPHFLNTGMAFRNTGG